MWQNHRIIFVRKIFHQKFRSSCNCSVKWLRHVGNQEGLYKRARNGEIKDFTGISSPYKAPVNPELKIDTQKLSLELKV